MEYFKILAELGFPIAAAAASGYFVFLTLKFILAGVLSSIRSMSLMIIALGQRVEKMNDELIRIDTSTSEVLDIPPDTSRISRKQENT